MKPTSGDTDRRVVNGLLLTASILLAYSIVVTVWAVLQERRVSGREAALLAEAELQEQLLASQPSDLALVPHLIDDVAFVLNPHMKTSTFRAHEGESYPVNALGLRGTEIGAKEPGVTRVALVGDSVVFGWLLREEDKLGSVLTRLAAEGSAGEAAIEFVTVALPGWNVRSQHAFLESHLRLLDPDLVIWWSLRNDIEDAPGVVPPGIHALWASPHGDDASPFGMLPHLFSEQGTFMPILEDRRRENIELIASFRAEHDIPVMVIDLPGFDVYRQQGAFDPPWIRIPPKYRQDERWTLSDSDLHPSPWAIRILAVGILDRLVTDDLVPEVDLSAEDPAIIRRFRAFQRALERQRERQAQRPPRRPSYERQLGQVATAYENARSRQSASVVYGVDPRGRMSRSGTLFLRDPGDATHLRLRLALPANIGRYPGSATFTVRSRDRLESRREVDLSAPNLDVTLALPEIPDGTPVRVFEVSWTFDYVVCTGPSSCSSGRLLETAFETGR